jgi:hypothetical protein
VASWAGWTRAILRDRAKQAAEGGGDSGRDPHRLEGHLLHRPRPEYRRDLRPQERLLVRAAEIERVGSGRERVKGREGEREREKEGK